MCVVVGAAMVALLIAGVICAVTGAVLFACGAALSRLSGVLLATSCALSSPCGWAATGALAATDLLSARGVPAGAVFFALPSAGSRLSAVFLPAVLPVAEVRPGQRCRVGRCFRQRHGLRSGDRLRQHGEQRAKRLELPHRSAAYQFWRLSVPYQAYHPLLFCRGRRAGRRALQVAPASSATPSGPPGRLWYPLLPHWPRQTLLKAAPRGSDLPSSKATFPGKALPSSVRKSSPKPLRPRLLHPRLQRYRPRCLTEFLAM
ncbi:Uncharacterised protein [Cedecea neteri]|uniref:Uncharacterized protein n=1 Tax=Cedecea neteri TaxID=158822 RepID=A0A2X3KWC3_9ENTR|nr:Uncharacterised protein [Cedecea neteri]